MATRVTINVASLIKEINKYDAKSLRRSTYQATKRIGFLVAKNDKKGLPFEFKSGKNQFRDPVDYTLKSINYAAEKNEVTFKTIRMSMLLICMQSGGISKDRITFSQ